MRSAYSLLLKLEAILAATFLVLMVILIFTGGVARLIRYPQNWTIDLATCFFAWAAFLCADIAWRKDALMSIELVAPRLPQKAQQVLLYTNYAIICAFLLYVIYSGTQLAWVSRARSFQGIPEISYSWVTMSLPVGGVLLLITTLLKVRAALRHGGPAKAAERAG